MCLASILYESTRWLDTGKLIRNGSRSGRWTWLQIKLLMFKLLGSCLRMRISKMNIGKARRVCHCKEKVNGYSNDRYSGNIFQIISKLSTFIIQMRSSKISCSNHKTLKKYLNLWKELYNAITHMPNIALFQRCILLEMDLHVWLTFVPKYLNNIYIYEDVAGIYWSPDNYNIVNKIPDNSVVVLALSAFHQTSIGFRDPSSSSSNCVGWIIRGWKTLRRVSDW